MAFLSDTKIWIYIVLGICGVLLAIAFYCICSQLFLLPSRKAVKNVRLLSQAALKREGAFSLFISRISVIFLPLIRFSDTRRAQMQAEIDALQLKVTPEKYTANAITKGVVVAALGLPLWLIHFIIPLLFLAIGAYLAWREYGQIGRIIEHRRNEVDTELPRFVAAASQSLQNDRNLLAFIETYAAGEDSALTHELRVAIADMKTGSTEVALTRLSERVDSVFLSETVRGLISTANGEDTIAYFETLKTKLWEEERRRIRKEALKMPGRIKYLAAAMMVCLFLTYVVVFLTVIMDSLGTVFSSM